MQACCVQPSPNLTAAAFLGQFSRNVLSSRDRFGCGRSTISSRVRLQRPQWCFRPEGVQKPFKVVRQPGPQPKTRFPVGSISPLRRNLGNPIPLQECLNCDLEIELETSLALDCKRAQHIPIVNFEGIACVVSWNSAKPMKRKTSRTR